MRKDEIEDRIVRLEQEFRLLKADHRDGVAAILAEMQKFQRSVMEERIGEIRERIAEGYEKIFLDSLLADADRNLDFRFLDPCVRGRRKECHDFLLARLRVAVQKIQDPDRVLPKSRETMSDRELVKNAPFLADGPCSTCFTAYLGEKDRITQAAGRFREGRESPAGRKSGIFLSEIPENVAISTLLEPLSHESRFRMLKALSAGSMTFGGLGELTGSKGGHLLYHLGKLMDAGLVVKVDAGKRYAITDRGMGVMDIVRSLYART